MFLCTAIKVHYQLIYTAHLSQISCRSPQDSYNHWEVGIFGAEAAWWKCCRRERKTTPKTQNFTALHSASCTARSLWRRCWHLTTRSVEAPCPPPQIPHLPRAAPKPGTKTGPVHVAKESWSSWISPEQWTVKLGVLSKYTLCMHPFNANNVYDPTRTYSEKPSPQKCYGWHPDRTKHAFVLKSHPKTIVTNSSWRYEKSKNCLLLSIVPQPELVLPQRAI